MKNILVILIIGLTFASCGNKDQVSELKAEVMAIHDEVMPEMGNLRKVRKQLISLSETKDSVEAEELSQLAEDIELANESMMEWMRNFEPLFEGTPEEKTDYLKAQKESIAEVKEKMLSALEAGQKALSE
jgi:hypothetical protein